MSLNFSIIVPVYNSVETLEPICVSVKELMEAQQWSYEIIFVEDHGRITSWQELLRLNRQDPEHVRIIRLAKNFGQNGATLCGIDEAKGERVITMDDDLQVLPEEILELTAYQSEKQTDVVYGVSKQQRASWIRRIGSRFVKRIFGGKHSTAPIGSSFRLINRNVVTNLQNHSQDHLFINQVITWYTNDIGVVEVKHNPRQEGKSGYTLWTLTLLSLRLILYYTSIPIKIMIFLSILTSFGIFGLTIYYINFQMAKGAMIDLFMITVLIAMAIIAGSISVFGVYINRIYSARVRRPNYSIKLKL
jgi:undecaprenyl-phosphate 4-deoxy-4-formamido-L-arabinose transferase